MTIRRMLQVAAKDENAAALHIGAYLVLFVAAVVMTLVPYVLPDLPLDISIDADDAFRGGESFSGGYGSLMYWAWLVMSLTFPAAIVMSYLLPSWRSGSRYFCIVARAGVDAGQIFLLLAYEVSTFKLVSAAGLYRNVLFLGVVVFIATMLVRDLLLISASGRLARRTRNAPPAEGG
jgi:hypothetical protein